MSLKGVYQELHLVHSLFVGVYRSECGERGACYGGCEKGQCGERGDFLEYFNKEGRKHGFSLAWGYGGASERFGESTSF